MPLKIHKKRRLPIVLEGNSLYMIPEGRHLKIYLTNLDGSSYKVLEDTTMLPKHGDTYVDCGEGVYTVDCRISPAIMTLPPATGSQIVRIVSFTHVSNTHHGGVLPRHGQTINGIQGKMDIGSPTTLIVIDSEVNGYTTLSSGMSGPAGPQGAAGENGAGGFLPHLGASNLGTEGIYSVVGNGTTTSTLPKATGSQNTLIVGFLANAVDYADVAIAPGDLLNGNPQGERIINHELRVYVDTAVGAWTTSNKRLSYEHNQSDAAYIWSVTHDLDTHPTVVIRDQAGVLINGQVDYVSTNHFTISFNAEVSGTVMCK